MPLLCPTEGRLGPGGGAKRRGRRGCGRGGCWRHGVWGVVVMVVLMVVVRGWRRVVACGRGAGRGRQAGRALCRRYPSWGGACSAAAAAAAGDPAAAAAQRHGRLLLVRAVRVVVVLVPRGVQQRGRWGRHCAGGRGRRCRAMGERHVWQDQKRQTLSQVLWLSGLSHGMSAVLRPCEPRSLPAWSCQAPPSAAVGPQHHLLHFLTLTAPTITLPAHTSSVDTPRRRSQPTLSVLVPINRLVCLPAP